MRPSMIREGEKDPVTLWMEKRGICEMACKDGHWSGMQEKTLLMFAGVPKEPQETILARLDAALDEARHPQVEAGLVAGKGKSA